MSKLGATGKYPRGKYTSADEGELSIAIASDPRNRKVMFEFGKPIAWLALDPEQAEALGRLLIAKARDARGEPLEGGTK